jgi:hypothetical protein
VRRSHHLVFFGSARTFAGAARRIVTLPEIFAASEPHGSWNSTTPIHDIDGGLIRGSASPRTRRNNASLRMGLVGSARHLPSSAPRRNSPAADATSLPAPAADQPMSAGRLRTIHRITPAE